MDYKSKDSYKHFFNPAPLVDWESNFKYKIVDSLEELKELLLSNGNNIISFDTETDGLDYNRNEIVGFSFSFNMNSGYYVPLRHEKIENTTVEEPKVDINGVVEVYKKTGLPKMKKVKKQINTPFECNLDPKEAMSLVYQAMCGAKVTLLHNAIFDLMMLRKEGFDISRINMFDTMVLCYNADTNAKGFFGLKPASEHFLGRRATKFKEVLGKAKTFKNINPVDCAHYACADSANTFGLFQKLYPLLSQECLEIMKLDNEMVKCFLYYYLDVPIFIDKKVMREYQESINTRRKELELEIFRVVGYPFNIRSKANELSKALQSMGIDTGVYSDKTNNMSVSKDALMNVQDKHPIAKDLIELSSLDKQINSYIDKLAECDHNSENPDIGSIKVNYRLFGTASGRLSSGTGGKAEEDDYFINLNIQNLPKPKPAIYEAVKISDDPKVGILGWEFNLVPDVKKLLSEKPDAYLVEGFSPEINVRRAVRVKDDSELILSIDFSAQEIKLAGILSGEQNFIQPFIEGKDVHTEMAIKLFGKENYDKEKRKSAKIANFGLLYGGNALVLQQVAKQYGMDMLDEDAFDLYDKWWKANVLLDIWRTRQWEAAPRNNFTVYDYFGRPRRVKYYLQSEEKGVYNFGLRTIISHKIQGTGSSIMRRLLVSLYKKIFSNEAYSKHVRYLSSVHDEVNYCIKKNHFTQWAREIEKMMVYKPNNFPIPIDCSIEVGRSLGELFPFKWEDESKTKLIPKRC